ncbi:MAG: TIGR02206 family membrane protein [Nocardioides sp.]|nr:TIGR02206 family membrane protein [Nocardioides sp.]
MTAYGPTHLAALAVWAVGMVLVIRLGVRDRRQAGPTRLSRAFAVVALVGTLFFQVYDLARHFDLVTSLPLQLCDVAWLFSVVALWTHRRYPTAITWFWGTLTLIALFAPATKDFPAMRYFGFWTMHITIVWAAFYLVVGRGLVPDWWGYRRAIDTTLVWGALTYVFNVVFDTNYGFLMRPSRGSPQEWLGAWPWYLVWQLVIGLAVWALLVLLLGRLYGRSQEGSTREPVSS